MLRNDECEELYHRHRQDLKQGHPILGPLALQDKDIVGVELQRLPVLGKTPESLAKWSLLDSPKEPVIV